MTRTPARSTGAPTRRLRRTQRVLVGGLAGGLLGGLAATASGATAASTPAAHVAPAPVSAQTLSEPSPLPRVARASRGTARTALPMMTVNRVVATGPTFSGNASWYGGSFQGQRTANGERFDTGALTAASKTLPFGTRLRVCRHSACVVVRVNDRGPYISGRVLDLSRAASRAIGFSGVAYVTATPIATRPVAVIDEAALARQRLRARQVRAGRLVRAALHPVRAVEVPVPAVVPTEAPTSASLPAPATVPAGAAAGMALTGFGLRRRTRVASGVLR